MSTNAYVNVTEKDRTLDAGRGIRVAFVRGPFTNKAELAPIEHLSDRIDVSVISSTSRNIQTPLHIRKTLCVGTLLESLPKIRRLYRDSLERLLGNPMYLTNLDLIVREHDVLDVPETHNLFSAQVAKLVRKYDKKLVVSVYENTPYFKEHIPSVRRTKQLVRSAATTFIAKTQQIKKCLTAEGVDSCKIEVIYSGVDTRVFFPRGKDASTLQRFSLKPTDIVLLHVGRLVWEKGVADVIRSLRILLRNHHDSGAIKLLVVGVGRDRSHLAQLIRALDLSGRVILGGAVPFSEMPMLYNIADVCLLASKPYPGGQEQEARVLRESLSCGKAMIATDCGGSAETVGDAAVLVPPADHFTLSDAMANLAFNPERRSELGRRARNRALKLFEVTTVASQIEQVYTAALQRVSQAT